MLLIFYGLKLPLSAFYKILCFLFVEAEFGTRGRLSRFAPEFSNEFIPESSNLPYFASNFLVSYLLIYSF
jgi:hypothetical protein